MELTKKDRSMIEARMTRIEAQMEAIDKLSEVLAHAHGEVDNELSYLRAELGLTGQPTLGIESEASVAPAADAAQVQAPVTAADSANIEGVSAGRCQACGHTEEAHRRKRAPGCSLCDCIHFRPRGRSAEELPIELRGRAAIESGDLRTAHHA